VAASEIISSHVGRGRDISEKVMGNGPEPLPPERRRNLPVEIFFNREERDRLNALGKLTQMKRGTLLRKAVLNFGKEMVPTKAPELNREAWVASPPPLPLA
jgi:hypothetical protein